MANPVSVTLQAVFQVIETLTAPAGDLATGSNTVLHSGLNQSVGPLNATSSPAAAQCAFFNKPLSAGAATIDLTAVAGTQATVNGNGQKVRAAVVLARAGNGAKITVKNGASNGHPCFGTAFTFDLLPGQWCLFYLADGDTAIAGASKNIDLAGTGSVDSVDVGLVFG